MGWLLMVFFVYFIITSLAFLFFIPNGNEKRPVSPHGDRPFLHSISLPPFYFLTFTLSTLEKGWNSE